MKIDADEKEPLESVERGEWKSAGGKRERTRYSRYAKATFRKRVSAVLRGTARTTTTGAVARSESYARTDGTDRRRPSRRIDVHTSQIALRERWPAAHCIYKTKRGHRREQEQCTHAGARVPA